MTLNFGEGQESPGRENECIALPLFSAPFCRTALIRSLQKTQIQACGEEEGVGRWERKKINQAAEDSQRRNCDQ